MIDQRYVILRCCRLRNGRLSYRLSCLRLRAQDPKVGHSQRTKIRVSIAILWDWDVAGKPSSITSASNSDFPGRMIVVTLCFFNRSNKKLDMYHKRVKGRINIFLASIYHLVDHEDQKRFNKELAIFYNVIPRNSELLAVQDVNSNIGVRSKIFRDVIGSNGINNRSDNGKDLLFLLNNIKFRLLLTYFTHNNYTTWRSFNSNRSPYMLDKFICSRPFFL